MRVVDGAAVRECGLCGERFGERRAVEMLSQHEEGAEHGYAGEVWPLVRALRSLRGLSVESAHAGDPERREMPAVRLVPGSSAALAQLENLATSLRLGAGEQLCEWSIEVESGRHLTFVLRPRCHAADWLASRLKDARLDLETLARHLERDRRLSWWHEASER